MRPFPIALMLALAFAFAFAIAPALAQPSKTERIDVRIALPEGTATGENVTLLNLTPGEDYRFQLNLTREYTTLEVRATGLAIERVKQLVPLLFIDRAEPMCSMKETGGWCDYLLFEPFSNGLDEKIWDVDGPARVYYAGGTADDVLLRLGVPGPVNATLVLSRDVSPPTFVLRPYTDITTFSFYQETVTDELAIGDLQVRAKGKTEWVQNPTPAFHYFQRFPVQGLLPNTTYEARAIFTDWAGNVATSDVYLVTSAPEPVRPIPVVTPFTPAPNSTIGASGVTVKAKFTSPESNVTRDGVRLFFDLREISEGVWLGPGEVAYVPPEPLAKGLHRVSVEVTNEAGGTGTARWSFTVGSDAPAPAWAPLVALAAAAVLSWARSRR